MDSGYSQDLCINAFMKHNRLFLEYDEFFQKEINILNLNEKNIFAIYYIDKQIVSLDEKGQSYEEYFSEFPKFISNMLRMGYSGENYKRYNFNPDYLSCLLMIPINNNTVNNNLNQDYIYEQMKNAYEFYNIIIKLYKKNNKIGDYNINPYYDFFYIK